MLKDKIEKKFNEQKKIETLLQSTLFPPTCHDTNAIKILHLGFLLTINEFNFLQS
jgi:hypothetical protein